MLVLTRRPSQSLRIGPNVEVRVVRIEGDRVVLGIVAPRHVAVVRSELIEQVSGELIDASDTRAKLRVMLAPLHAAVPLHPAGPSEPEDPSEGPSIA
jgi:carbon storage regulator